MKKRNLKILVSTFLFVLAFSTFIPVKKVKATGTEIAYWDGYENDCCGGTIACAVVGPGGSCSKS